MFHDPVKFTGGKVVGTILWEWSDKRNKKILHYDNGQGWDKVRGLT